MGNTLLPSFHGDIRLQIPTQYPSLSRDEKQKRNAAILLFEDCGVSTFRLHHTFPLPVEEERQRENTHSLRPHRGISLGSINLLFLLFLQSARQS